MENEIPTDYIDLYQVHGWGSNTPLEETLRTLNDLVRQGKVRYIGRARERPSREPVVGIRVGNHSDIASAAVQMRVGMLAPPTQPSPRGLYINRFRSAATRRRFSLPRLVAANGQPLTSQREKKREQAPALRNLATPARCGNLLIWTALVGAPPLRPVRKSAIPRYAFLPVGNGEEKSDLILLF